MSNDADTHKVASETPRAAWSLVRWIVSGLLAAVTASVVCLPWVFGTPERITGLFARAIPDLAAEVKPERVTLGWFGPMVLDNVAVVPRNGDHTPLTIRRVEVEHGLAGILLSAGDLGRVRVDGLAADVVFDREHRSNFDSILPPREPGAAPRGRGPRRSAVTMRLEVVDAVVRITGPWTSDPWVSEPIDVKAALANGPDGLAVWTVEPVQLLANAELQQTVAHEVLAYIVPVFADAARTSGRFSLNLDGGTFPVGRPAEATLAGRLQMHEVVLGPGPLVENMFRSLPLNLPPPPTIRIADEADVRFQLADRRMWHEGLEFGIPLRQPGQRLDVRSQGSVGLDDRSLDLKLSLPIPADLPQDRPLVAALAGKEVSLGVGGFLGEPKVNFDGSIKQAAGQVVVDLIDRLRNGPRPQPSAPAAEDGSSATPPAAAGVPGPPAPGWSPPGTAATPDAPPTPLASQPAAEAKGSVGASPDTTEAIVDLVGGVLNEVARRRAERQAAEAANPNAVPPRRGRLFPRRPLAPPPAPAVPPVPPVPTPPAAPAGPANPSPPAG